uniref:Uncharacterized protein n=1 Tax=Oryza brachyantha TaxID=4533 RepID=J3NCQ6_ORYBR
MCRRTVSSPMFVASAILIKFHRLHEHSLHLLLHCHTRRHGSLFLDRSSVGPKLLECADVPVSFVTPGVLS